MDLLKRVWRGEETLFLTFWGYGVGGNILWGILLLAVLFLLQGPGWLLLAIFFGKPLYGLFMSVAIWRSANRYEGRVLWAVLAKIAVVFWWLQSIGSFLRSVSA